jgi:hypothetical protein
VRSASVAIVATACAVASPPAAAVPLISVPPALNDARAAIAALTSYSVVVSVRDIVRDRAHDRTVTIAVKRPATKMTIIDGATPGTAIAWRGEGKARLRRLGILARLPAVSVDRNAASLAFADGAPVTAVLFSELVASFDSSTGTIAQSEGPTIAGRATDDITEELTVTAPAKPRRIVLTLDRATHLPVRFLRYVDDNLTELVLFDDVVVNAPLRDADVTV